MSGSQKGSRNRFRTFFGFGLALVGGSLAGFFIVFNSVFSDPGPLSERIFTLVLTAIVYALLAAGCAWLAGDAKMVALVVAAPGIVLLLIYSFREPQNIALHMLYAVISAGSSWYGARPFGHARRVRL